MRSGLANLYAVAERYPELKADTLFRNLAARISALETAIADRREIYNDAANAQKSASRPSPTRSSPACSISRRAAAQVRCRPDGRRRCGLAFGK